MLGLPWKPKASSPVVTTSKNYHPDLNHNLNLNLHMNIFSQPESSAWPQSNLNITYYPNQTRTRYVGFLTPQFRTWHHLNPSYPDQNVTGTHSTLCNPYHKPIHPKPTPNHNSSLSDPDPLKQMKKERNVWKKDQKIRRQYLYISIYSIVSHTIF